MIEARRPRQHAEEEEERGRHLGDVGAVAEEGRQSEGAQRLAHPADAVAELGHPVEQQQRPNGHSEHQFAQVLAPGDNLGCHDGIPSLMAVLRAGGAER